MRRRGALLAIALAVPLAACDHVFALEPPVDAPPVEHRVTGELRQQRVINDETGAAVFVEAAYAPGRASALVAFPDRSQVPVTLDEQGTFSFMRPAADTPYRLVVFADNQVFEVQHAAPSLTLRVPTLGRPNAERTPVTQPTIVATPVLPGSVVFASTGLWSLTTAIYNTVNYYVDWSTSTSQWGRRGLLSAEQHDRFYALGYETLPGTTYVQISNVLEATVDMADGQTLSLPGPARAASPNVCAHLTAALTERGRAFEAALPAFGGLYQYWHLQSLPSYELGLLGVVDLAYAQVPVGSDLDVTATVENPFPGADTTAVAGVYMYRQLAYPGAHPVWLYAAARHTALLAPTLDCAANTIDVTPEIGVPGRFALDGVPLDLDGATVVVDRGSEATLSWEVAVDGPVDRWVVTLFEVFEETTSGITTTRVIRAFQTVETALAIDSALLLPGGYYIARITAQLGYAGAHAGDLGTVTAPVSTAYAYTGMFQVQ